MQGDEGMRMLIWHSRKGSMVTFLGKGWGNRDRWTDSRSIYELKWLVGQQVGGSEAQES